MFADSFGANLAVFVLGQVLAWWYLRTGLTVRGIGVLIAVWVLADVALVLRFAYADTGWWYVASLGAMQAVVAFEAFRLVRGRVRRRGARWIAHRDEAFGEAVRAYLRDDLDHAAGGFRDLVRGDPWDLAARVYLGAVEARRGQPGPARRQLVRARRLDRDGRFVDAIETELRRAVG